MRLGTLILQTTPWNVGKHQWLAAEQLGFDVAYAADHLTHPTMPGQWLAAGWTTTALAASVTTRIDIGLLVASAAIRNPVAMARSAATIHDASAHRFVLGIGAGTPGDVLADRGAVATAPELAARFAEVVDGMAALWDGATSYAGEQVAFDNVVTAASPDGTRPHLMIAAHGPKAYRLVAKHGDGWNTYGGAAAAQADRDEFFDIVSSQRDELRVACDAVGRDVEQLRRSLLIGFGGYRPLESVDAFLDAAERTAAAGFDELVTYWPQGAPGDRFWTDPEIVAEGVRQIRG